jgi:predicted nucleic-acid-binding protein
LIGLDTNVLIRYLTRDDPAQARIARRFITHTCTRENQGFVDQIVLCELVWVLQRTYRYDRERIAQLIEGLLSAEELLLEDEDLVRSALAAFRSGADFADHLIGQINERSGCDFTATFDRHASRGANFHLLG